MRSSRRWVRNIRGSLGFLESFERFPGYLSTSYREETIDSLARFEIYASSVSGTSDLIRAHYLECTYTPVNSSSTEVTHEFSENECLNMQIEFLPLENSPAKSFDRPRCKNLMMYPGMGGTRLGVSQSILLAQPSKESHRIGEALANDTRTRCLNTLLPLSFIFFS